MTRRLAAACFALAAWFFLRASAQATEVIHVFVALADNASQGLVPVPAKIGNGDDPANNLYWGCDEGVRSWFTRSAKWKKMPAPKPPRAEILERLVFKHKEKDAWLVADAWRGSQMKPCLQTFAAATAGQGGEVVNIEGTTIKAGGDATLLAFIGHNGLMDFSLEWPEGAGAVAKPKPVVVLCCMSQSYFGERLRRAGAHPLLTTTQLMYPGAFILHDAAEVWLSGGKATDIRAAAGRAYAKNQGISVKAATGVFAVEPPAPASSATSVHGLDLSAQFSEDGQMKVSVVNHGKDAILPRPDETGWKVEFRDADTLLTHDMIYTWSGSSMGNTVIARGGGETTSTQHELEQRWRFGREAPAELANAQCRVWYFAGDSDSMAARGCFRGPAMGDWTPVHYFKVEPINRMEAWSKERAGKEGAVLHTSTIWGTDPGQAVISAISQSLSHGVVLGPPLVRDGKAAVEVTNYGRGIPVLPFPSKAWHAEFRDRQTRVAFRATFAPDSAAQPPERANLLGNGAKRTFELDLTRWLATPEAPRTVVNAECRIWYWLEMEDAVRFKCHPGPFVGEWSDIPALRVSDGNRIELAS